MSVTDSEYGSIKVKGIAGRYVIGAQIDEFLEGVGEQFKVENIGFSLENRKIRAITLGYGPRRILMWSQMHGNESTTTKAVLDLIAFLGADTGKVKDILALCTLKILPMLNPDGAERYTRFNAANVDLNRDAQDRSQPESRVLREVYDAFFPHFCFNLHDQRTLFNVGDFPSPATMSFLAPAYDEARGISPTRGVAMQLVVAMNKVLQKLIPGQIGRFDDSFNANCVGDAFQMLNTPTVLFEAGHFQGDYDREETRKFVFQALWTAVRTIAHDQFGEYDRSEYFKIPENKKLFFDVLIRNIGTVHPSQSTPMDMGIRYKEVLEEGKIRFEPYIESTGDLNAYFGHRFYDCSRQDYLEMLKKEPFWGQLGF